MPARTDKLRLLGDVDITTTPPNDGQALVFDNGSGMWIPGDAGGGGGGLVVVTVPEDHGAVGDGSTNDTTALQAWLNDDRPFKFLPGNTYITNYLDVPADITILGAGDGSILKLRGASHPDGGVLQVYGNGGDISGVVIANLQIDGNKANVTASGSALNVECIDIKDATGIRIHNVTLRDAKGDGIDLDDSTDCIIYASHAYDCGGWGFHFSHGADQNKLYGSVADNCGHDHSRGGIDQWDPAGGNPGGTRNSYIGNTARDCHRNYAIRGSGATFIGNQSYNGTNADILTGVADAGGGVDLSAYPSAASQPAGKVAETDGADGWSFIDTPTGGGFASGTDEIDDTESTAVVAHGLEATPETVLLTPRANETVWVSDRDSTNFTAERSGTSGALAFDWLATGEEPGPAFTTEVFTASGTWDWSAAGEPDEVDVLIVAGGGGGGASGNGGGGGGAGGLLWEEGVAVAANVSVVVGGGGDGATTLGSSGGDGDDSEFGAIVASGGGGGSGAGGTAGSDGGSGGGGAGGASGTNPGGSGTVDQGNDGGFGQGGTVGNRAAGGGGGAGAAGTNATSSAGGPGGQGVDMSAEVGTDVGEDGWFAGGGGGSKTGSGGHGAGGQGGGGSAGEGGGAGNNGQSGDANTGGGGGGGGGRDNSGLGSAGDGGSGGSGVVIVRYPTP